MRTRRNLQPLAIDAGQVGNQMNYMGNIPSIMVFMLEGFNPDLIEIRTYDGELVSECDTVTVFGNILDIEEIWCELSVAVIMKYGG